MRPGITYAVLLVAAFAIATDAAEETVFADIFSQYEAIRQVLIEDSTEGVAAHAAAIAAAADGLEQSFSAASAGVGPEDAAAIEAVLPEVVEGAKAVSAATDLDGTRDALAELTKPLVRWQELIDGPRPVVAYCPMVKKAWLQPDEAIGNPYAPNMLRCGEVVQR